MFPNDPVFRELFRPLSTEENIDTFVTVSQQCAEEAKAAFFQAAEAAVFDPAASRRAAARWGVWKLYAHIAEIAAQARHKEVA